MDVMAQAAERIIEEQQNIIGPLAIEQAKKVEGLKLDWEKHEVALDGDKTAILQRLVEQYSRLFGKTSVEVCRDSVRPLLGQIPADQLPDSLR